MLGSLLGMKGAEFAKVLVVKGEPRELLLVDGSDHLGVDWGQDRLLLGELGVEVARVFFVFLKCQTQSF